MSRTLRPRDALLVFALTACFARAAAAQVFPADNGDALTGLEAVDAQVLLLNWLEMPGDPEPFRRAAQAAFRSELARAGVSLDGGVSHFLFCELKVARAGRPSVVYSWAVGLYEFVVGGPHRLQWTTGGIVRVGRTNFSPAAAVEECADGFRREWTRRNPPPG